MKIVITPEYIVDEDGESHGCSHIISIRSVIGKQYKKVKTPKDVSPENHWHYFFDDATDHTKEEAPTAVEVADILNKIRTHKPEKLLVHCWAGVSRSTAISYTLLCDKLGPGKEAEALALTEESALFKGIHPNTLIVDIADKLLNREGKMVEALKNFKPKLSL
jgi:predicted protein tyrosine phosphatase